MNVQSGPIKPSHKAAFAIVCLLKYKLTLLNFVSVVNFQYFFSFSLFNFSVFSVFHLSIITFTFPLILINKPTVCVLQL